MGSYAPFRVLHSAIQSYDISHFSCLACRASRALLFVQNQCVLEMLINVVTIFVPTGFYMYVDSSSPRRSGDRARLSSGIFLPVHTCLRFSYYMWGEGTGRLDVVMQEYNRPSTLLWRKVGSLRDVWQHVDIAIYPKQNFKVGTSSFRVCAGP